MLLSIVIPTFSRDGILCDTLQALLLLAGRADEIVVVDQTRCHNQKATEQLAGWDQAGDIRWIRLERPSITGAMNRGALEARGDIVLFLDDDIVPDGNLIRGHMDAYQEHPEAWAVVGQVIQPEDVGEKDNREFGELCELREEPPVNIRPKTDDFENRVADDSSFLIRIIRTIRGYFSHSCCLRRDLKFPFNGTAPAWVENVMAGNLSVRRERFLQLGGFDENFTPPVSYRFETEFAKRLVAAGGRIRFEPEASILHLRAPSGGTRSRGSHLASGSPIHGVGDYYYALRCGQGWQRVRYILRRPFREVCTRFHLQHPWWIPVKLVGELRAIWSAWSLYRKGPKLLHDGKVNYG